MGSRHRSRSRQWLQTRHMTSGRMYDRQGSRQSASSENSPTLISRRRLRFMRVTWLTIFASRDRTYMYKAYTQELRTCILKSLIKERFPQTTFNSLCRPLQTVTLPESVIPQENNSPLTLYINLHNSLFFLNIKRPIDQVHAQSS